jgi:hypothetical protein
MARFTNPLTPGDWVEGYHGEFDSMTTQAATVPNVTQAVMFENTILSEGVTVEQDENEYFTKITPANPGVYNVQFSGQIHHTGGGGGGETFSMWFRKNGIDIPNSRTVWHVPNGKYAVPVLNIFLTAENPGDYFQLVGHPDNAAIVLESTPASESLPGVPSMILTVNQVA